MSAIWGIIDFQNQAIASEDCRTMEAPFHKKKIGAFQSCCQGPVFLGCGLQYVSEEAKKEAYPYEKNGCLLVADAILDNREELAEQFSMVSPLSLQGVDGSMLFDCVTEDLDQALDAMLGAYVFALWDSRKQQLTLANDVTGTRSVYYLRCGSRFYISSLIEPLLPYLQKRKRNDQWFFNFYAQDGLRFVDECRMTPYEGIFRLEPGEILTVTRENLSRKAYWNPFAGRKTLKLPNHEAYAERVRQVFGDAVRRLIRGDRDAAILLSGGLDSNAVAAFAAPRLRELGKSLCSFTSVPDAEHARPVGYDYYVADERSYVELLQKKHDNLKPHWVGCNSFDYLQESRKAIEILEAPYKTIPNMPWMLEAYRQAAEAGCSALLTGQYGNITISVGSFENLFETLLKQGKLLSLARQVKIYSARYHKRRRWTYGTLLECLKPQRGIPCAREELSAHYQNDREKLRRLEGPARIFPSAMDHIRSFLYDRPALRQVGETELKLSLETGVIPRDPTRDKRLIELVLSLPVEELCLNGVDRRLVREDMEGLIPPEILKDFRHRGQQGVGAEEQLLHCWPEIREELRKEYESGHAEDFLNLPCMLGKLDALQIGKEPDTVQLVRLIYCGLCSEYLGNHYDE